MSAYSAAVLADTPKGYWRLGEPSGTAAADTSGFGHPGTYVGTPTLAQPGALVADADTSVLFNGSSQCVTVADHADLDFSTAMTLEGWFFPTSSAADRAFVTHMAVGSRAFEWRMDATTRVQRLILNITPDFNGVSATGLTLNAWNYVAVTVNTATDVVAFYLNGQLDGTGAFTPTISANANTLQIGRRGGADDLLWLGGVDEVAVYDSALSPDRILYHYQAGTGTLPAPPRAASATKPGPLTVIVTSADGSEYRLGADELDAAWVPVGINWESVVPGGWKGAGFSLRRRVDEDVELRLFDEVEIIDEHGQTMYEGRIVKLPRQHGDDFLLDVQCLGWASHLLDDKSFREVYVDRDASGWQPPSLTRVVQIGAVPLTDYQASVEGGFLLFNGPADIAGGKTVLINSEAELDYRMPVGCAISKMMYVGTEANTTNVTAATLVTDDNEGLASGTGVALTLNGALQTATVATPERYGMLRAQASAQHLPTAPFKRTFSKQAMYGNSGLTTRAISATEPDGLYVDDMLADVLRRAAPKLNFTQGVDSPSIERPPVVVPHASYPDPSTAEPVILDLNKGVLWDWLVYEKKTFFYRPTDPDRLTWEARLDQGIHLALEGDDAEFAFNGAMVRYTTPDGVSKIAGPTGSGLDVTSDLLADTDTENTVNQHGYARRWIELTISFPTLDDYAVVIGAAYLAQAALPSRSGDIEFAGDVGHPTKGPRPAREMKASEWVLLSDHPADVPRRMISVRHDDDSGKTNVTVGNEMNKIDALLESLGVQTKVAVG